MSNATAIFRSRWFSICLCADWYFGYQLRRTFALQHVYAIDLLVIPGVMLTIGIPGWRRS